MKYRMFVIVCVLFAMLVTGCAPAAAPAPAADAPTAEAAAPAADAPTAEAAAPAAEGAPEACAADAAGCAVIPAGQTVKIGMGGPMTGDYAMFGVDISNGAKIAVLDAGEVEGFKFELVAQDTQGSPEIGATVANKFVTDPTVVAIAGHIFSGETEAAMPIYEKASIPMLSPSATNPPLTELGSKVFNRIAFTDKVQGEAAAAYLKDKLGFAKIAVIHDGSAYGKGLADVVKDTFTAAGGEVVEYQAINPGEVDYSATLSAVAAKKPEAIYFGGYSSEAIVMINQLKQTGLKDVVFFGCDGTYGQDVLDKTGENGVGAYSASVIPPASDAKTKFDAEHEKAYGQKAGVLSPYTWSGYDVTAALTSVIKSVAVKGADGSLYVPRTALVAAVRGMKGYQGITGDITCNETGECNTAGPTFYVIKDGQWVEAEK